MARFPSNSTRSASAPVITRKLARPRTGLRNASAALQRQPRRWVTSNREEPRLSPRLKSATGDPRFRRRALEGVEHFPAQPLLLYPDFAAGAMEWPGPE